MRTTVHYPPEWSNIFLRLMAPAIEVYHVTFRSDKTLSVRRLVLLDVTLSPRDIGRHCGTQG